MSSEKPMLPLPAGPRVLPRPHSCPRPHSSGTQGAHLGNTLLDTLGTGGSGCVAGPPSTGKQGPLRIQARDRLRVCRWPGHPHALQAPPLHPHLHPPQRKACGRALVPPGTPAVVGTPLSWPLPCRSQCGGWRGGGLQRRPGPGPAFLAEWPRHRWDGPSGRSVSLEGRPVYLPRKQLQQKCAWGGGRFARCHAPPKVGSPALGQTGAVWGLKVQVTVFRAHGPGGQTAARSCTDLQAQESRPAAPSLGRPRSPSCQGSRARRWPPGTPERDPSPSPARPGPPRQPLHRRLGSERVPRPPGPRSLEEGTL